MGANNREIELKLEISGISSIEEVNSLINTALKNKKISKIKGISKDVYWEPKQGADCDFIRLRYSASKEELSQITVKKTDRVSNLNRVEIDVEVDDSSNAFMLLRRVLGKPLGEVHKEYTVFWLNKDENVSTYKVYSDSKIYVEIEALNSSRVNEIHKMLKKEFNKSNMTGTVVKESLYQRYVKRTK